MSRQRTTPRLTVLANAMSTLAASVAEASPCNRAAVGCVLTTLDLQVVSYGYNGVAKGLPNQCLRHGEIAVGNCGCVHAEQNAVAKAGSPDLPKIAFITMPPCERCASLIVNAGVVMVCWATQGHRPVGEGIENVLEPLGIPYVDLEAGGPAQFAQALGAAKRRAHLRPV